jgi:hypothetical protein
MADKSEQDRSEESEEKDQAPDKPAVTLPGTVEKIIPSIHPSEPEKAQIAVEGADHLYREIRVENVLQDPEGNPVSMKKGTKVEVTIEAESHGTTPKTESDPQSSPPKSSSERLGQVPQQGQQEESPGLKELKKRKKVRGA